MLTTENEKLQLKVEDLRNDVKLNEEALTQYTVQQNLQLSNAKQESSMLSNTLEKERVNREKIQSEVRIYSATSLQQPPIGTKITGFCREVAVAEMLNI